MPPEHNGELCDPAQAAGIDFIRLTTPTTDDVRLPTVLNGSSGFVLRVGGRCDRCRCGNSGARRSSGRASASSYRSADQHRFRHPHPEQAANIARLADGVVVGSALIDHIANATTPEQAVDGVLSLCSALAEGVRKARVS
jgi:tryptophan synthase alpha chain